MAENGEKGKLLSPALMGFLRRRTMEACGLLLILAGGTLTAMLFSPGSAMSKELFDRIHSRGEGGGGKEKGGRTSFSAQG